MFVNRGKTVYLYVQVVQKFEYKTDKIFTNCQQIEGIFRHHNIGFDAPTTKYRILEYFLTCMSMQCALTTHLCTVKTVFNIN